MQKNNHRWTQMNRQSKRYESKLSPGPSASNWAESRMSGVVPRGG